MSPRFVARGAGILILLLAVFAISRPALTQASTAADAVAAHELLWFEVTAAVLAIGAVPDPAAVPIAGFKTAQARLETAIVRLINTTPPLPALTDHLALLPFVQEVAAAARAVVDAMEKNDEPGVELGKDWLDDALAQLAAALRQARALRAMHGA